MRQRRPIELEWLTLQGWGTQRYTHNFLSNYWYFFNSEVLYKWCDRMALYIEERDCK